MLTIKMIRSAETQALLESQQVQFYYVAHPYQREFIEAHPEFYQGIEVIYQKHPPQFPSNYHAGNC